jgi:predicted RNA-binding Zn-ribbon protein involved in translation (DUF1610 family)
MPLACAKWSDRRWKDSGQNNLEDMPMGEPVTQQEVIDEISEILAASYEDPLTCPRCGSDTIILPGEILCKDCRREDLNYIVEG